MGKFLDAATEIGKLVDDKNQKYGDSFAKASAFLRLLYPDGVPPEKYDDMLTIVRMFDKLMRIATAKDAYGENPFADLAGYALLAVVQGKEKQPRQSEEPKPSLRTQVLRVAEDLKVFTDGAVAELLPGAGCLGPTLREFVTKGILTRDELGVYRVVSQPPQQQLQAARPLPSQRQAILEIITGLATFKGPWLLGQLRSIYSREITPHQMSEALNCLVAEGVLSAPDSNDTYTRLSKVNTGERHG